MLVLTRKQSEAIQIGEDIEIEVIAIEGEQVKLGIRAPKSVDIYRKEIYVDITNQNNEAAIIDKNLLQFLKNNNS
ncbi:carbon storage regulator [Oceanobacillus iheyensis HTE831]|uniref:Translational regulator CsrA n=1 Tax=Oceanobacillus iheyensis (strain DSM 14371 / CIP 107618 / JCM 11309 / KCTC 3954 / HTE831) TaxID=221109 RepID=CSRA_OCEIH|nr:carbon storage regulator CsrA [Oceanobacillus iheyensis]Q8ENI0.1 RecName: Full=Translational regulator CsrA [Oceanobacillus iheyensis HTE831]BAC14459.1 carbon storage regulator [Oceanobacillus iheyensis HTE831]